MIQLAGQEAMQLLTPLRWHHPSRRAAHRYFSCGCGYIFRQRLTPKHSWASLEVCIWFYVCIYGKGSSLSFLQRDDSSLTDNDWQVLKVSPHSTTADPTLHEHSNTLTSVD